MSPPRLSLDLGGNRGAALAAPAVAAAAAEDVRDMPPPTEEPLPRLLEELVGLGPGTGVAATRLGVDTLCLVIWWQV